MDNADKETPVLGTLSIVRIGERGRETSRLTLKCHALAVTSFGDELLLAGVLGTESDIKALHAWANTNSKNQVITSGMGISAPWRTGWNRVEAGYRLHKAQVAPGLWHALLVARVAGLMPAVTPEALWQELRSKRFTVPVLRSWMPAMLEAMQDWDYGLEHLRCVGCNVGWLTMEDEGLERAVTSGLECGVFKIQPEVEPVAAWEQTREEYIAAQYVEWRRGRDDVDGPEVLAQLTFHYFGPDHEVAVADAMAMGKTVSEKVLADYPHLLDIQPELVEG